MVRIILFLGLIALAAAGAAWVADQTGDVSLSWGGWRVETTMPVFALALGLTIVAGVMLAGRSCAGCGERRRRCGAGVTNAGRPAGVTPSRKDCSRSATAIPPPPAAMPMTRGVMPRMIRWRCC